MDAAVRARLRDAGTTREGGGFEGRRGAGGKAPAKFLSDLFNGGHILAGQKTNISIVVCAISAFSGRPVTGVGQECILSSSE